MPQQKNIPKNVSSFLWYFIKRHKAGFIIATIAHLAWALDWTVLPYIFKVFLDGIINFNGDRNNIWPIIATPLILGAGFWILIEIMFRTFDFVTAGLFPRFTADLRLSMFDYTQHHSYKFFSDNFAGSVSNKINDTAEGSVTIMQIIIINFIPALTAFAIALSIFFFMHPLFAVVSLVWVIIHLVLCFVFAKRIDNAAYDYSTSRSKLIGRIVDSLSNSLNSRLFAQHKNETQYIAKHQNKVTEKQQRAVIIIAYLRVIQAVVCFLFCGVLNTYLMIRFWQQGILSAGDVSYIFYTGWNITIMAWIAGMELPNFYKELGICKQGLTVITKDHEITDKPNAKNIKINKGEIKFDNVSFAYRHNDNIFSNQSITIKPGEKVGLVGFSGSGKTTFVRLILRLFDIHKGRILVDGQNIANCKQESLHKQIALIPQDPQLFHRSVKENLRYGASKASDKTLRKAAKLAHADEFIKELPEGYDSLVGEKGVKLSGGQRQRIAIARAILKDAPILIFDEATSALDSVTEKYIQDAMQKITKDRTTIIIAHRLSTLNLVDRIIVFDKGHIVEQGTHQALLKQNGIYAKMWKMQAGGFLPEEKED